MLLITLAGTTLLAADTVLLKELKHLRIEGQREWADFPEQPDAHSLKLEFSSEENADARCLSLRQQDLKQTWQVSLNGKQLGRLPRDENDMRVYFEVPAKTLKQGSNVLTIEQSGRRGTDDIRVGQITLHDDSLSAVLNQSQVTISVTDKSHGKKTPCRITVINEHGSLATVGVKPSNHLAVRPGVIFTSTGEATFGLPPGKYTIYAGRGFEWGIDSVKLDIKASDEVRKQLSIQREVDTAGLVSCDTHVHTFTHSRHGDASISERMVTLAAEAIEFPIATDHNIHIDYEPLAKELGVRQFFTPVIGNEVTTKIGHFNVFPIQAGAKIPDYRLMTWDDIFASIFGTPNVQAVIINHARDLHSGVRPFGPKLHNATVGRNLEGWKLQANAMELINSGATQTDPMQLYNDWFGLLNRGHAITPVGCSDSHDVARHFVGQGRTYIYTDDSDVSKIDVAKTVKSFTDGRVLVSYGLLTDITVGRQFGAGQVATNERGTVLVNCRVQGPSWTSADRVDLYANGQLIRSEQIRDNQAGIKWKGTWKLRDLKHDVHLVAVARGPGIDALYWSTAKAYQPDSPVWEPYVIGSTGAVWVDVDGDEKRTTAFDYAQRIVKKHTKPADVIKTLANYDAAVAAQVADLWHLSGNNINSPETQALLKNATAPTKSGFDQYRKAQRASKIARAAQ
ncbi:MAG: hypothetical protein CMJ78_00670 [Planctomycetaceae bacterium]|nr:hypothetical protein [Planctomycetaceae bacterium]